MYAWHLGFTDNKYLGVETALLWWQKTNISATELRFRVSQDTWLVPTLEFTQS